MKAPIIINMVNGLMNVTDNPKKLSKSSYAHKEFKTKIPIILVQGKDRNKPNLVMDRLWGEELEENPKDKEIIKELQKYTYDKIIKKQNTMYSTKQILKNIVKKKY